MRRSRLTRIALAVAFGLALWQFAVGLGWVVMGFLGDRKNAFARVQWHVGGHVIELDQLIAGVVSLLVVSLIAAVLLRGEQDPIEPVLAAEISD
jgi:hypothetical protein